MPGTRRGSVSGGRTDRSTSKDGGGASAAAAAAAAAAAFPSPACDTGHATMDTTWPDHCDPPPKSKGKSVKLKKNSKTENTTKKLIRQGSKDSVVLVGYKNLQAPYAADPAAAGAKHKGGEAPANQESERDAPTGDAGAAHSRTTANSAPVPSCSAVAMAMDPGQSAYDALVEDSLAAAAAYHKGYLRNLGSSDARQRPEAGPPGFPALAQDPPQKPAGVRHIEVKPRGNDPFQGDKVTVLLPHWSVGAGPGGVLPEIAQANLSDLRPSAADPVPERPGGPAAAARPARSGPPVQLQVQGDCIRLPDAGVPYASKRLSDSGIDSEPCSLAALQAQGVLGCAGLAAVDTDGGPQGVAVSPAPGPTQHGPVLRASGRAAAAAADGLFPEITGAVRGTQSSLTSINSLPSDEDEGCSRGPAGPEAWAPAPPPRRKSSILVHQEQSVVFSGDAAGRPAAAVGGSAPRCAPTPPPAVQHPAGSGSAHPTAAPGPGDLDPRSIHIDLEPGPGSAREAPAAACPSSASATSSTDVVKRGMVEDYFGSRSSTDVSEISPLETSGVTLGAQKAASPVAAAAAAVVARSAGDGCDAAVNNNNNEEEEEEEEEDDDDDEEEHENIQNGFYEEGDGYRFANGVAGEEDEEEEEEEAAARQAEISAVTQETRLLLEQLRLGYLQEPQEMEQAPICPSLPAPAGRGGSSGGGQERCGGASVSPASSLHWYQSAPAAQMKA